MKILAINPGSTSTKVALFDDDQEIWNDTQRYDVDVLKEFHGIMAQQDFRLQEIRKVLEQNSTNLSDLNAVVGRGGLLKPIPGGTYEVNQEMLDDLGSCKYGSHASNLGAGIAVSLAREGGCNKAYIVDPVVVDELIPEQEQDDIPRSAEKCNTDGQSDDDQDPEIDGVHFFKVILPVHEEAERDGQHRLVDDMGHHQDGRYQTAGR